MKIEFKLLKTEEEYQEALNRINELIDCEPDSAEEEELILVSMLVEQYEEIHYPIEDIELSPIEAIKYAMERLDMDQEDLVPFIGSRSKVSEVLSGKRSLSLNMIRRLSKGLGISADDLIREQNEEKESVLSGVPYWNHFKFDELVRKNCFSKWFSGTLREAKKQKQRLLTQFLTKYNRYNAPIFYARQDEIDQTPNHLQDILLSWQIYVMNLADDEELPEWDDFRLSEDVFRFLVNLSYMDNGSLYAKEYLNKLGIHLIFAPEFEGTNLDGIAMFMPDGHPLIGMTLRHDSLDFFWITLFHEISHLLLHFDENNKNMAYKDDMSKVRLSAENRADCFAMDLLIPEETWKQSGLSAKSSEKEILEFAEGNKISPAIPAGRIRFESQDYEIFKGLVGEGTVRRMFDMKP